MAPCRGMRPRPARRARRFRPVCNQASAPGGAREQPLASKAAKTRPAVGEADRVGAVWKALQQQLLRLRGKRTASRGKLGHARPEGDRVAQSPTRQLAEPAVVLSEHDRPAAGLPASRLAVETCRSGLLQVDAEWALRGGQPGAGGEADQVDGVRQVGGLVEVVNAPDEPAFSLAALPKVLAM